MLRTFKILIQMAVAFTFVALCIAIVFFLYIRSQPLPHTSLEGSTTIYDAHGDVIDAQFRGIHRKPATLTEIPRFIQQATIAIEDRNFYSHYGFDPKRIVAAIVWDIKEQRMAQGASTITQQLARNLYLTHEKTWTRKLKELTLAIQLELHYSKDEILEMYLNQIYYGNGAYGIRSAALTYFGKDVDALTLAEGTLLVGIPKGPSYYEPFAHFESAKKRQRLILQAMVDMGHITAMEAETAAAESLQLVSKQVVSKTVVAPYFRDAVLQEVKRELQLSLEEISQAGLHVYTTLSLPMQQWAEKVIAEKLPNDRPLQAAIVAMDPDSGHIKAMVGGREYAKSQYNRAYARRQPGSAFKPFLYLAAIEKGMTPLTEVESKPTVFQYDGKYYIPSNYQEQYAGKYITMLEAIKKSDNIYAVSTLMAMGEEQFVERAEGLGITNDLGAYPSIALGSHPLAPMTMVSSYATLANLGIKVDPVLIERIEDRFGKVLYINKAKKTRVADPRYVYVLSHMLQTVFDEGGTAHRVSSLLHRPTVGKTGTTPTDAWMLGYTPQLVAATWIGFDDNTPLSVVDTHLAAPIWAEFMEGALAEEPPMPFTVPEGLVGVLLDVQSKQLATANCTNPQLVYFIPGTEPRTSCALHPEATEVQPDPLHAPQKKKSFWERIKEWW